MKKKYLGILLLLMISISNVLGTPFLTTNSTQVTSTQVGVVRTYNETVNETYILATDSALSNQIVNVTNLDAVSFGNVKGSLTGATTYYWQSNASNGNGNYSSGINEVTTSNYVVTDATSRLLVLFLQTLFGVLVIAYMLYKTKTNKNLNKSEMLNEWVVAGIVWLALSLVIAIVLT